MGYKDWIFSLKSGLSFGSKQPIGIHDILKVNAKNEFFENNKMLNPEQASEAKKKNLEKSKKPAAEQGIWSSIIDCPKKRNGLPCVAFIFSRKRCDSSSAALLKGGTNLNTEQDRDFHFSEV